MCDKKEYIERGALLNFLNAIYEECRLNNDGATSDLVFDVIRHVEDLPAADVVEVRHGTWTLNKDGSGTCNQCGTTQKNVWDYDNWQNYCGCCGARMDGERKEQT